MKLYRVTIEREMLVAAEDERKALRVAERFERDEITQTDADFIDAQEITDAATIPDDWRGSLPWGGDGEHTCEWYVRNREPEPFIDTKTPDLFEEA